MLRHRETPGCFGDECREGMDGFDRSLDVSPAMLARHALHRSTASMLPGSSRSTASSREIARLPSCSRPSRVKRWRAGLTAALTAAARDGGANLGRDGGMVRVLTEQRNDGRLAVLRQGHSSPLVQRGSAFPMIALVGSTPKYRPSSESADCQFMRKTSPSAMTRQPCQIGQRATSAVALARFAHRRSCRP